MWESQTHNQLNQVVEGQEPATAGPNVSETITEEPEAEAQASAEGPNAAETTVRDYPYPTLLVSPTFPGLSDLKFHVRS